MEEDKPFGGPDQDFVFGEFAKAEYEVCRKQVVGIVPGISFDDFPGRDVQKVDSGVECPYPQPAAVGKQAVDIGCRKQVDWVGTGEVRDLAGSRVIAVDPVIFRS